MSFHRVIIIGGGVAGVGAACKLLENGFSDFLILEGSDRLGGRVHSIKLGEATIDLGAQWVHGEVKNPIYELGTKYDCLYKSELGMDISNFFCSDGTNCDDKIIMKILAVLDDCIDKSEEMPNLKTGSLGKFVEDRFWLEIEPNILSGEISKYLCTQLLHWFEQMQNSIDGSPCWHETSIQEATEYVKCEGCVLNGWKLGGYSTILDILTKKVLGPSKELPLKEKVLFNREVVHITWNDSSNVKVQCADQSEYFANHVIFTGSLGVLKERYETLFSPSLPTSKINAIKHIGIGTVNKLILKFPYCWWEPERRGISLLWHESDRQQIPEEDRWLTEVIGFYREDNQPLTTLIGWITGKAAEQMEQIEEKEVANKLIGVLRRFVGDRMVVPEFLEFKRSRWFSNPLTRGSYTCRTVAADLANAWPRDLAEPLVYNNVPVVLFAGEATHDHFFSTVHGALESGWREADRLLSLLKWRKVERKVAIVGAGIAGLSAALTLLHKLPPNEVVLLEANKQPGGRIRKADSSVGPLDLGAEWIHGSNNEIYRLSEELGLLSDVCSVEGPGRYYQSDGSRMDENAVSETDCFVKKFLEKLENEPPKNCDKSVGELLHNQNFLNDKLLRWHEIFLSIDNGCETTRELSSKYWNLFKYCGGLDCVNFKNSFYSLVECLVQKLPFGVLNLNVPVTKIHWGNPNKILVETGNFIVFCDYVIITASLGVLKEFKLFEPELPRRVANAIEKFGFGGFCKVYLVYHKPWWGEEKGFQLLWDEKIPIADKVPWGGCCTGFDVVNGKPVLLCWVKSPGCLLVEEMDELNLNEQAKLLLEFFTKRNDIPLASEVFRSQWMLDPFVKGAYSYISIKCDSDGIDGETISQRITLETSDKVKRGIYLAGEACSKHHYSTVHGAFESGRDQALKVLDDLIFYE